MQTNLVGKVIAGIFLVLLPFWLGVVTSEIIFSSTKKYVLGEKTIERLRDSIIVCENIDNEDDTYCVVNIENTKEFTRWLNELYDTKQKQLLQHQE